MQASKAPVKNAKPDTTEIIRETNRASAKPKSIENEAVVSVPPTQIGNKFSGDHAMATNVSWAKETAGANESDKTNYKAVYVEDGKKNWITYTESGVIVEERHEILTDQLPQNIYNSIKVKYPDVKIVSASTYKHLKQDGSYAVVIRPLTKSVDSNEQELIVRENGTFVQ